MIFMFNQFASDAVCTRKNLPIDNRRTFKHTFRFLRVWPGALSTRHTRGVHTRNCSSESMGSRFGGPGQKALQTMNEFTLFVDFCLISLPRPVPLTYQPRICKDGFIFIVKRPLISLWYAICSTGRWSIIGCCVGACQRSSCAEERRP